MKAHKSDFERCAVVSWFGDFTSAAKRALILFDRIVVPVIIDPRSAVTHDGARFMNDSDRAAFEYLESKNLGVQVPIEYDRIYRNLGISETKIYKHLDEQTPWEAETIVHNLGSRSLAQQLRTDPSWRNAGLYPIYLLQKEFDIDFAKEAEKEYPILLTLKSFPIPRNVVPLDEVVDFRNEDESVRQRVRMFNWLNQIDTAKTTPQIFMDELAERINSYSQHQSFAKRDFRTGTLKTIIKLPLDFLENLIRIKPSKFIDALFTIKESHAKLSKSELSAPGNEVAYLVRSKQRFS